MPEGTSDAVVFIATSWQALNRVIQNDKRTLICDSTITILFAAFFIEANLNYIVKKLDKTKEMKKFLNNKKYPGMQDKLGWFYNTYIAKTKAQNKNDGQYKKGINRKLRKRFPGFAKIYKFRNDISHGKLDQSVTNRADAEKLRQQAKNIVTQLFNIVSAKTSYDIPRVITYQKVIDE